MTIKTACLLLTMSLTTTLQAQAPGNGLTQLQQQRFQAAQQKFQAGHFAEALADMRALQAESPENRLLTLGTAETAIEAGQPAVALDLLKQYDAKHPDDWSALTYEARVYAENGQAEKRDALLARLLALHKTTTDAAFQKQVQFLAERVPTEKGHIDIFYSLQPWSRYNIAEMARVFDEKGQQTYRVTLESSDFEQTNWSKEHPDLAAKGMRLFTIDGYTNAIPNGDGTATQTHSTYAFLDGQPAYNAFRERALTIAAGKGSPMSSTKIMMDTRPKVP